jgi:flagellar protein FliL
MAQEPKKEAAAAEGEAPKGGKKKLIIIIAAVLALAGGGAGWYFTQAKHKGDAKDKHEKHEEAPKPPEFLALETFTVNLQPDPDERFLQLDATLQVAGHEVAEQLKTQMPAIRNRMLMLLTSKKASDISTTEGKTQLSDEMLAELKKPFTKDAKPLEISSVLFTSFVIQ